MASIFEFANPKRFMNLSGTVLPWLGLICVLSIGAGRYRGFTALALITGSLWGKPMWGAYWVWDARLTSFLLLLFLYLGYMALWNAIEDETRAARAAAILALVGVVNLPIIEFSVDWWNTLHQGESIIRSGGPLIAGVFLWPLGLMAVGYTTLFFTLWMIRIRTEIINRRARALQLEIA